MTMLVAVLGWFGTVLYLANHAYISLNAEWRQRVYYTGNLLAAVALVISSAFTQSWQAIVINGFWAVISFCLLRDVKFDHLSCGPRFFHSVMALFGVAIAGAFWADGGLGITVMGWSSAFAFSAVYLMFSAGRMLLRHYLLWNLYASTAMLPQLWLDANWPVFTLEVCWGIISLYGAVRRFREIHLIS